MAHARRYILPALLVATGVFSGPGPAAAASNRLVRVGCDDDYAPFFSRSDDNRAAGFGVEVLRAAAQAAGLTAEVTHGNTGALLADLRDARLDVLLTTGLPGSKHTTLSTTPFYRSTPVLYGRRGETGRPDAAAADREVAMVRHLISPAEALGINWPMPIPLGSGRAALRALARGEVDFVVMDRLVALDCLHNTRLDVVPLESLPELGKDLPFFVRAELPEVAQRLSDGLVAIKASGEWDHIYNRWFGIIDPPPPTLGDYLAYTPALALALVLLLLLHLWRLEQRTRALQAEVRTRERLQGELRTSEDQFRQIAENINEVFWVSSLDKRTMYYVSPAYARIWGRPVEELLTQPRSWMDAIHPDDRARVRQAALTRQAPGDYDESYRILRPDGSQRWIRDRAFPVSDHEGKVARLVGIAEDITAQQEALARVELMNREQEAVVAQRTAELTAVNQALRESQERLQALLHTIPDMVFRMDRNGTFLDYSVPHAATHVPRDRIIGRNLREMGFPEAMVRDALAANEHALSSGQFVTFEYTLPTGDGPRNFEARVVKSGPNELVSAVRDITERRQYEEQRRALETRLFESQKMESMGTLAGGIAHDFNNILGAILGYSELLQMDAAVPEDAKSTLQEVIKAGRRGAEMVRQILTFSRRQRQERRPINLPPVVRESMRFLRSTLPATVEITSDIASEVAAVDADPTQIQQVLMNLCTNAAYAMRDRPGRLTVTLCNAEMGDTASPGVPGLAAGTYVRLSVQDTGVGIAEADLPRIFEPFFTTKPPGEGTGLGLSVVHGIIKDHEGAITVTSRPQIGTTFQIYLPALAAAVAPETELSHQLQRGRSEHILFVDDEAPMADMARRLLMQLGYRVTAFTRPEEAVSAFMAQPASFALVVTDLNMPRFSGLDLARAVHATDSATPILLVSGFLAGEQFPPPEETGIAETLAKPFTARQLSAAVRRLLDGATRPAG